MTALNVRMRLRWTAALAGAVLTSTVLAAAVAAPAQAWGGGVNHDRISYINYVNGVGEVWSMTPGGTDKQQLTNASLGGPGTTATKKCDPAFSPLTDEVAYAAQDGGVYVLHDRELATNRNRAVRVNERLADTTAAGQLIDWTKTGSRRPTWSPDGLTLVFHLSLDYRDSTVAVHTFNLYRVTRSALDAAWGPMTAITNLSAGDAAFHARFSPDGQHISYSYQAVGTTSYKLYVMRSDGAAPAATAGLPPGSLIPLSTDALLSSWNASGSQIAYVSSCAGGVYSVGINAASTDVSVTSTPRLLTNGGGCGSSYSSRDDNLLSYADSQRVYVLDLRIKGSRGTSLGAGSMPGW